METYFSQQLRVLGGLMPSGRPEPTPQELYYHRMDELAGLKGKLAEARHWVSTAQTQDQKDQWKVDRDTLKIEIKRVKEAVKKEEKDGLISRPEGFDDTEVTTNYRMS